MGDLSNKEMDSYLLRIRNEYREFAKENPAIFKLSPFEERYTQALRARGNMEKFFKEELNFLETLKQKHEQVKQKKEASKGVTIDRIVEENESRARNYRKIDFSPSAKNELKHFYGAISDFVESELQLLYKIFKGTPEIKQLEDSIIRLERLGLPKKDTPSQRIQEHLLLLHGPYSQPAKIEQDVQNIMKDSCHALKSIIISLEGILENKRLKLDSIIGLEGASHTMEKYRGMQLYECLDLIIKKCQAIIIDFRMDGIVGLKK